MDQVNSPTKALKANIRHCLETYPATRDSDRILYYELLKYMGNGDITVYDMLFDRKIPNYDSVSRIRRMIQKESPELRGSAEASEGRMENEMKWYEVTRKVTA